MPLGWVQLYQICKNNKKFKERRMRNKLITEVGVASILLTIDVAQFR